MMASFGKFLCVAALSVAGASLFSPGHAEIKKPRVEIAQLKADVSYLADDLLEGREVGTRGYDLAALYVSRRMEALGLKPGGVNGTYMQPFRMRTFAIMPGGKNNLSFSGTASDMGLLLGKDYFVLASPMDKVAEIEAPAVFVGYGFVSRTHRRDDFAGVDVNGKIAVILTGAPQFLNSEESAHFNRQAAIEASKRGAVSTIFLSNPAVARRFSFERMARYFMSGRPRTAWMDETGSVFSNAPNIKASAAMSSEAAARLFEALGRSWADVTQQAGTPQGEVPAFDLGVTAHIASQSRHGGFTSANVAGIVPGKDKRRRSEYVVVSAHLDHLGIRHTLQPDDDEIYNGAMDNATGVASLLETARLIAQRPPRRSVIFLAVTAEEKGLIGSDYFAHHPTVPKDKLVADINIDMPVVTYDFQDLVAFGAERSTLFTAVQRAVKDAGLTLSPDPMPEEGIFTRSDHYRFVQQGIPSAYLMPGFANGGEAAWQEFLHVNYHKPSDEVGLVNFTYLQRFASLKHAIIRNIANMRTRPAWYAGDFFGETFHGPMAKSARVSMLQTAYDGARPETAETRSSPDWPHHPEACFEWMYPCAD